MYIRGVIAFAIAPLLAEFDWPTIAIAISTLKFQFARDSVGIIQLSDYGINSWRLFIP